VPVLALLVAFVALLTPAAHAQTHPTWVYQPGAVLDAAAVTLTGTPVTSIGSPSVVYDDLRGRWFMLFEAKTDIVDARCPQGVWGIGAAVSTDGVNWTPFTTAILKPTPGNGKFYSCVAGHPTAVFSPLVYGGNGGILAIFKAEQDTDACATTTPSWGCATATGLGRLQIELQPTGDPKKVYLQAKPVHQPATSTFGYPKLIQDLAKQYRILYQAYPDIVSTSSYNIASFPAATTEITLASGGVPWAIDEVFNPSVVCADDPVLRYRVFVGGRNTGGASVIDGAWGEGTEDTFTATWLFDAIADTTWTGNAPFRHWDVTKLTTGDYLIWFDEKDALGNNFIRFGGTTLTFNNSDAVSKVCL
jgi:hypothetical protein